MKIPWELVLVLVLLAIVATATQQVAPDTGGSTPDLVSDSAAASGGEALYLWLQSLGYRVERLEYRAFRPDDATSVLLMLSPSTRPVGSEVKALRQWVERGGTLILVGAPEPALPRLPIDGLIQDGNALSPVLAEFDLELRPHGAFEVEATPSQPLLLRPVVGSVRVEATGYVTGSATSLPYLGEPERPVAAGAGVGEGHVYVLASTYAFSNQGLGQADNAAVLLNWLPSPRAEGIVAFDEIHHGRIEERSLAYVVVREPWGWATLYALAIAFLYLLLDGRRFGRPVPGIADTRRAAAEYAISMAGLLRRGGKAEWVSGHYELALKRNLTTVCGFDPSLDTVTVAARLKEIDQVANGVTGKVASQALIDLNQGGRGGMPERRLVHLAAEADRIIKACGGRKQ